MKYQKNVFSVIIVGLSVNLYAQSSAESVLSSYKAIDIKNKEVVLFSERNSYALLLFCDPENINDRFVLEYAQVIYEKYRSFGLNIIGISKRNKEQTRAYAEQYGWNYHIISDSDHKNHEYFGKEECCGGTILATSKKGIIFSIDYLISEESMRQLIENMILGRINYRIVSPEEQSVFVVGKDIPHLKYYDLKTERMTDLTEIDSHKMIVNYFASFCGQCGGEKRLRLLKEIKEVTSVSGHEIKIIIVFQKPINEKDIIQIRRNIEIPFDIYIGDNILPDNQKYITDYKSKNDPLMIVIRNGKVAFVETIGIGDDVVKNNIIEMTTERIERDIQ